MAHFVETSKPRPPLRKESMRDAPATRPSAQAYRLEPTRRGFERLRFSYISRTVLRLWQL